MKSFKLMLVVVMLVIVMIPSLSMADEVLLELRETEGSGTVSFTNLKKVIPEFMEEGIPTYQNVPDMYGEYYKQYSTLQVENAVVVSNSTTLEFEITGNPERFYVEAVPFNQLEDGYYSTPYYHEDYIIRYERETDGAPLSSYKVDISNEGEYLIVFRIDFETEGMFFTPYAYLKVEKGEEAESVDTTPINAEEPFEANALPTSAKVLINGDNESFQAYNINGNNYFKLRDLAYVLTGTEKQFDVSWDSQNQSILLTFDLPYTVVGGEMNSAETSVNEVANPSKSIIYKDGDRIELIAYNINGNNYFKLRDIASHFDFGVSWDGNSQTILVDTSIEYISE